jgi:hypothetical protein
VKNPRTDRKFLAAGGADKYCRIYDDGGKTIDRYTVCYTGRYRHKTGGVFWYVGMDAFPCHPRGFGQHGEHYRQIDVNKWGFAPIVGRKNHLGRRILFKDLPIACKTLIVNDLVYLHSPVNTP